MSDSIDTVSTIEGRNAVIEALRSGRTLNKILFAHNIGRHSAIAEILHLAQLKSIPVEFIPRESLDRLSETGVHQGVIAYVSVKEYITLDELLTTSQEKNEPALYCILDGIEDPHNLGAIIRTAGATGIHGVVIRARRAVGLTATVAKASAGAIEYVPVCKVTNISETINTLQNDNIWVVGIDSSGKTSYYDVDFKMPTAIVIGSEGKGVSDLVKKRCDYLASIPMQGKISSLNASVAAAVVMFEAFHQRIIPLQA